MFCFYQLYTFPLRINGGSARVRVKYKRKREIFFFSSFNWSENVSIIRCYGWEQLIRSLRPTQKNSRHVIVLYRDIFQLCMLCDYFIQNSFPSKRGIGKNTNFCVLSFCCRRTISTSLCDAPWTARVSTLEFRQCFFFLSFFLSYKRIDGMNVRSTFSCAVLNPFFSTSHLYRVIRIYISLLLSSREGKIRFVFPPLKKNVFYLNCWEKIV